MNKITKRKDGRYQIKKQINGFKIDIIDKNKQSLILKYRAQINTYKQTTKETTDKILSKKIKNDILYKNWLDEYYNTYKKPFGKEKTQKEIKRYIEILKKSTLANIPINKITPHEIQQYINTLPYSRTKELIIRYLKSSLKKYLKIDLFEDIILDPKINNIKPPFSYEEQKTIWNNLQNFKYKNIIIFYLFTGIRKNELPTNFNNILLEDNHLIKIKCEKKKSKEDIYKYIDLSPYTFNFIKNNIKDFNISTETIYRYFNKFLKELNIKGSLHTLRHTFTNNYYVLGINLKTLSNWLGHAKTETTIEHYVSIDRTITKEKIIKLYGNFLYKI